MDTKQAQPSLSGLIGDLWSEAVQRPGYEAAPWQALVALAPVLEVRVPPGAPVDVRLVESAMTLSVTQRSRRLRRLVRRLRAAAELERSFQAAPWRALELQLGLVRPARQAPTKRALAIAALRERADAVLSAMHGNELPDEEVAHRLRVLIGEAARWRAGGAWLHVHLATVLQRCGDLDDAYRHATVARDADPLDLRYHLLCRKLGDVVIARDAGFTSRERGQA